ncbi:MAG: CRTAC homolog protein [Elainellaceae cyanobacterium]
MVTKEFEPLALNLNTACLYDVGVVDANQDDTFDIFTTNHNGDESLLLGSAAGTFTDVLSDWDLNQAHGFPGFGQFDFQPPANTRGFYIYRSDPRTLHLQLQQGSKLGAVRGEIVLPSPDVRQSSITVLKHHRATINVEESPRQDGLQTRIQFTIRPNGHAVLDTRFSAIAYSFKLKQPFPLNQVYVGAEQINPRDRHFILESRDRHGMAWADYQGDGLMDVFMARGGLRGQILNFPQAANVHDELLINRGNDTFQDRATQLGITKQGCRSRQAAWVDFNGDNRLDLYVSGKSSPNQLFQQRPNGTFKNVAPQLGLDFHTFPKFVWLDADGDHRQDLLVADDGMLKLYTNEARTFQERQTLSIQGLDPRKLAIADFDHDGDLDVYVASPRSSRLLVNTDGTYTAIKPNTIGLPNQALTANWVDYNNDGLTDLQTLPGGLYQQTPQHQFVPTSLLSDPPSSEFNPGQGFDTLPTYDAWSSWFDLDNNGTRDALYVTRYDASPHPQLYLNTLDPNHWLQVNLVGAPGNRQAIGAQVLVKMPNGTQLQQVGQSEGSHLSQGHYRLYFGLGAHTAADIEIIWADGKHQVIQSAHANQLLTAKYSFTSSSTLVGTNQRDILCGTSADDGMWGRGGRDRLLGNNGIDQLHGGRGADQLLGGRADDWLVGNQGRDRLRGGRGDDILTGNLGNDWLKGNRGDDELWGGLGKDMLIGGRGRDTFVLEKGAGFAVIQDLTRRDWIALTGGMSARTLDLTQDHNHVLIRHQGDLVAIAKNTSLQALSTDCFIE